MEVQLCYIGIPTNVTMHKGGESLINRISGKDTSGTHRNITLWGEYADTPIIGDADAQGTVICIMGVSYNPAQGYMTTRRYVFSKYQRSKKHS